MSNILERIGEEDVPAVVQFLELVIMTTGMVFFMTLFMTL
jgi:hypothetical protein